MTRKEKSRLEAILKKEYLSNKDAFVYIEEINYDYLDTVPYITIKGRFGVYKKDADDNFQYNFKISYEEGRPIEYIKGMFANEISWREFEGENKDA